MGLNTADSTCLVCVCYVGCSILRSSSSTKVVSGKMAADRSPALQNTLQECWHVWGVQQHDLSLGAQGDAISFAANKHLRFCEEVK